MTATRIHPWAESNNSHRRPLISFLRRNSRFRNPSAMVSWTQSVDVNWSYHTLSSGLGGPSSELKVLEAKGPFPPNLSKVGEGVILSLPEFVRLWFFDIRILPVTLCCLDNVLRPGVAGVLRVVYIRPGPSMAPNSSVCSSASSPMTGDCSAGFG